MKKLGCIVLMLMLIAGLAGCVDSSPVLWDEVTRGTTASRVTLPSLTLTTSEHPTTVSLPTKRPATTATVQPTTGNSVPCFSSLVSLRDYMTARMEADDLVFSFVYTGTDPLDGNTIARMTNACYISYNQNGNTYTVTATEYPGDRIVDAYRSGRQMSLTVDEKRAMTEVVTMVNAAKAKAADAWELEVLLHDALCERITYDDHTRQVDDPLNPPRNLTVIGALLDGKANCQGYADAFYTVASIAGFTVSRMSVKTPNDLHMVNTILLDGAWYVVDVDSNDHDNGPVHYRLFNVGREHIHEYTWLAHKETHPIAARSGTEYYYRHENTEFSDIHAMARYMADAWARGGHTVVRAVLYNATDDKGFTDVLNAALDATGKATKYNYWYCTNGRDAFFWVEFK